MRRTGDLFGHENMALEPPDGQEGRDERGAHYTDLKLAFAMCRQLARLGFQPKSIFEPGCGGGAFLRAAFATWPDAYLVGVDLVPACMGPGLVVERDLFDVRGSFDLIVGNPDFARAEEIIEHCKAQLAPGGLLAFLLLSDFEGSQKRQPFWLRHPLYLRQAIGGSRPSFREDGQTDMRPYSMFGWKEGYAGAEHRGLAPLDWASVAPC